VSALQRAWGCLQPTETPSRAQGAMWRGLALRQEVVLGPSGGKKPQDRVRGQVRAGQPAPSSNSKAAEQGHLQYPKDLDGEQAEGAGAGDHPQHPAILPPLPGRAPLERPLCLVWVSSTPPCPPQHRSLPGLAKWRSCRRQGCLITEQPWKPATAAALWPGGEAAGL